MRTIRSARRRAVVTALAVVSAAFGTAAPGRADVPDSCAPHPVHVVNPGCVPALTSDVREPGITLPDISPDVREVGVFRPFVMDENGTFVLGEPKLVFDSWVQNFGTVPLQLMADDPENPTTAMQCVSWTGPVCREKRVVGEYVWHAEHNHFHYADFAQYELRRLAADGRPDYSGEGLLAISEKVSFCLLDVALIDVLDPAPPFYVTCGPTMQGVSPKWADVYGLDTPGQSLEPAGLTDGRYALVVRMDHANRILETDDTDNVVEITVEISENETRAAIVGRNRPTTQP